MEKFTLWFNFQEFSKFYLVTAPEDSAEFQNSFLFQKGIAIHKYISFSIGIIRDFFFTYKQ